MIGFVSGIVSFVLGAIDKLGYVGIFLGMTIESSFLPLPSELMLIPAGALISQGKMNFAVVFLAAILGSILGAIINYFIALSFGRRAIESLVSRYGKFLFIGRHELDSTDKYFLRHGEITTFIGRLLPGIRHLISLPAGFAKMDLFRFSLFTGIGAGFWSLVLIYTGWLADKHQFWLKQHPVFIIVFILTASFLIISSYILFIKYRRKKLADSIGKN
ncbi:MAG: DedA family protein [Candidatus Pacearchaeota archaeon]|nr:DedA family protein [Candidatus Pacearchaeota archaeon]